MQRHFCQRNLFSHFRSWNMVKKFFENLNYIFFYKDQFSLNWFVRILNLKVETCLSKHLKCLNCEKFLLLVPQTMFVVDMINFLEIELESQYVSMKVCGTLALDFIQWGFKRIRLIDFLWLRKIRIKFLPDWLVCGK